MSNVVSMESKLEALEQQLLDAELVYGICLEEYDMAKDSLEKASIKLANAIAAMEKLV